MTFFFGGRYLVPDDPNTPYDMLEIVKKVVDEGVVTEIMPDFAKNIICGFARMEGRTVGVSTTTLYFFYYCSFL
jgi:acetyl-CoA carboxylase carboxyltransferase component